MLILNLQYCISLQQFDSKLYGNNLTIPTALEWFIPIILLYCPVWVLSLREMTMAMYLSIVMTILLLQENTMIILLLNFHDYLHTAGNDYDSSPLFD